MPEEPIPEGSSNASSPRWLCLRVAGFPVSVEPSCWWVSLVGLHAGLGSDLVYASVSFVSNLVQVLWHAMVTRRFGGTARIRLYMLGGLIFHSALPKTG